MELADQERWAAEQDQQVMLYLSPHRRFLARAELMAASLHRVCRYTRRLFTGKLLCRVPKDGPTRTLQRTPTPVWRRDLKCNVPTATSLQSVEQPQLLHP